MELQDFTSPALARMVGLAFGTVPGTDQERMLAKRDVQGLIGLGILTPVVPRAGQRVLLGRDVAQPRACADGYLTHRRQVAQPQARTVPAETARTVPATPRPTDYSGAGAPRPVAETLSAADLFRASLAGLRVRRR